MRFEKPVVVAECGCNHMGDLDMAIRMIQSAARCGAQIVKFQKRCPKECLSEQQYNAPHPVPHNAFGSTYGEHRERLEFPIRHHVRLAQECQSAGVRYSTSVWDLTSAKEVIRKINPDLIKIPSACNRSPVLLAHLDRKYSGDIHISTGMMIREEIDGMFQFISKSKNPARYVVYGCTSGYPVPFDKVYLLQLPRLQEQFGETLGCHIGFSGHHLGIAVDIAAYALGATYFERHFTLDRTLKGTDHAASLEEPGLSKLCRDLAATHEAMKEKPLKLDKIEMEQRQKLSTGS